MSSQPERERGDKWAAFLRRRGWWVQKVPGSSLSGIPDWEVGMEGGQGVRRVEAKTLEAVLAARDARPRDACSGAQRFHLDRYHRAGDECSLVVLGPESFLELCWASAHVSLTLGAFSAAAIPYS